MDHNEIAVASYGICIFSVEQLSAFLKQNNKGRVKRVLERFQKDQDLYLKSIALGAWLPMVRINSVKYQIRVAHGADTFSEAEWEKISTYGNFNLAVGRDNAIWICSIGTLLDFNQGYFNGNILSHQTLDGYTLNKALKFNIPEGRYLVTIEGYRRREMQQYPKANSGYLFSFVKVDDFLQANDPREDRYDFNNVNN